MLLQIEKSIEEKLRLLLIITTFELKARFLEF